MSETYVPKALRQRVALQARYRCGYCLTSEAIVGTPMEIDHIIPQSLCGPTEEHNLWQEHFAWPTEGDRVIGLTPAGRATVAALHLNRPSLVRARQAWVSVGWHLPTD